MERVQQHWLFEEISEEMKPKVLDAIMKHELSGTVDEVVVELSKFKDDLDVLVLGLPMMGELLKNGLDMINLLKDHIVPKL